MTLQQIFQGSEAYFEPDIDIMLKKKWNPISDTASENMTGHFECNICLDSVKDPVVTLCGHLYCWPCIYKWLHVQSSSPKPDQRQQKCPVCSAEISDSSLVPLYVNKTSSSDSEAKKSHPSLGIPHRPRPSQRLPQDFFPPQSQTFHPQQYLSRPYGGQAYTEPSSLGGFAVDSVYNPTIGMLGDMVYATMYGSSGTSLFTYPNSYTHMRGTSSRVRRHEMQIDKSLNRVSIFLFCCVILCLLLF